MAKKVTQTIEISDTLWKVSTDKDDLDPFYVTGANGAEAFTNGRKHILKLQEKAEDEYEYLLTRIIKVELMGDVYEQIDSEGLMFHIYEIIAYMTHHDRYINGPSEKTRYLNLQDLHFESNWWGVPPKYVLDQKHREKIVAAKDERERQIKEDIERMKPFNKWCEEHNPCNTCTEKVPLTSLSPGWHHDCEICYNGSCPKMRHFFDVEYREEIKKYRKD